MRSLALAAFGFALSLANAYSVNITHHTMVYHGKDLCVSWEDHCRQWFSFGFKSSCQPVRKDANVTTIIEADCYYPRNKNVSVAIRVVSNNGWDDPDHGFVVPHAAATAVNLTRTNGSYQDEREKAEYQGYYDFIQQHRSTTSIEKLQTLYNQYEQLFAKPNVNRDWGRSRETERDGRPLDQKLNEVKLRSFELLSFEDFCKLSEMRRQVVINHASGVAKKLIPYPDTALKHIQHLKYRDEAFKLYGYEAIEDTIEDLDTFVEKKRRGRLLSYPA